MAWRPSTDPAVITCALTGGIHGKEANPALPEQPDEIVEQGIAAWKAGAAVLHVHARRVEHDGPGDLHRAARPAACRDRRDRAAHDGRQSAAERRGAHHDGAAGARDVL